MCSKVNLLSIYVYCIMLRSANSQTNVKIDINGITNFQSICQNTLTIKGRLGIFVFESDVFINQFKSK